MSLVGMLGFAITGLTLNHAASIGAAPMIVDSAATLPRPLLTSLANRPAPDAPLPTPVVRAVKALVGVDAAGHTGEWSAGEVYVALPRPGGDAWVSIDRANGAIKAEVTSRGWVSFLNDLHKGRNAGIAWFWFIDVFAAACILFTLTGLLLLWLHARRRPSTWPLVAAGLGVPFVIVLFLIH